MHIHQISVFLENRIGQLAEITNLLAEAGVDIRALSIAETSDYGLARMIVDDSQKASSILLQHGDILSMTPVWAVEVPDRPGGLAEVLGVLADAGVDVEYVYAFVAKTGNHAWVVMRVNNNTEAERILRENNITLVSEADIAAV